MSLLSLRDSLSRAKAKVKKRLGIGPTDSNPSAGLLGHGTSRTLSPGITAFLHVLDSGTEVFGPLRSAVNGLSTCFRLYEDQSKAREDCVKLQTKIDSILQDLSKHINNSPGSALTNSVKLICLDLEAEVKITEELQARSTGRQLIDAMEGIDELAESYLRVQTHFERLTLNLNLSIMGKMDEQATEAKLAKLCASMSAAYNSAESDNLKRGPCTQGTREAQINMLLDWARTPESGKTCWMNGMAGTGKTTIAYSVCTDLDAASALGASFFCSRTIPECRQVKHIIPSIAYQLARFSLPFRCELVKALDSDPDANTRALNIQYKKLIVDPLIQAQKSLPTDFIVVIDALDECDNEDSVGQILDLILSPASTLPIRFLVSSRPEREIARRLGDQTDSKGDTRLVLHDLASEFVRADIEAYVRHELRDIQLAEERWPMLIESCGVLFIYASTSCRYLKQAYAKDTLDEAISLVTGSASKPGQQEGTNAIDQLYLTVLMTAFNDFGMSTKDKTRMRDLLETVICAIEPMTMTALALLLGMRSEKQVNALLQPLRSVLNVAKATGLVTTLHASFPDFMLSEHRSGSFFCPPTMRHISLAEACLRTINTTEPKFNICSLSSSYLLDNEVEGITELVGRSISPGLIYACRHWSTHLRSGEYCDQVKDCTRKFFLESLLLWMEVMNLTKSMVHGPGIIQEAERWCNEHAASADITGIAHDAWHLVTASPDGTRLAYVNNHSTLHLLDLNNRDTGIENVAEHLYEVYSVAFSADGARLAYGLGSDVYICGLQQGKQILGPLKGHANTVISVAFSPNSLQLATGSNDWTIRVWDTKNGHMVIGPFNGHENSVKSVSYSPDGTYLASASYDRTIRVWALETGQTVLGPLAEHSDLVLSVTFSPNGSFIASGSADNTIRVYNAQTGQTVLGPLSGHAAWINTVIFSQDSARLYSCSDDGTVCIWNTQGLAISNNPRPTTSLSKPIHSIRYSHSGLRLVSGSEHGTIHVWDVKTGDMVLGPLQGHTDVVSSVDYSPDDAYIASGSDDNTLRIWDAYTGNAVHGPLHSDGGGVRCVRFSPDSSVVASGSDSGTVQLWDVKGGQLVIDLFKHNTLIHSLAFSPDGRQVVAGSNDRTIQVIDRQTGETTMGPINVGQRLVSSAEFCPDGSRILSCSFCDSIQIWDAQTGQHILTCGGPHLDHVCSVYSAAFSPDGLHVVSGALDGTFSPDGSHVASCSDDCTIRFWDVSSCKPNPPSNPVTDAVGNEAGSSGLHRDDAIGSWLLNEDGWVVDSKDCRLVWVPSDLRNNLLCPPNDVIISEGGSFELKFDGVMLGENWVHCYQP
ncbi:unnamed protein product [Rhizoctonia solani]|uniref:Nephrocystin 3-like N-terminal domain-containing protein n=1 Tax=Rhizoctonia solani TaxID=456999 RepID=A0A8H3AI69_9AGAM|nr:unnamed protein product [Rhizoctonia solani]